MQSRNGWILSGLVIWLGFCSPACAQGLLGTFHVDGQFSTSFLRDSTLSAIDPSVIGYQSNLNAPLIRRPDLPFGVDVFGRFGGAFLDGQIGTDRFQVTDTNYSVGTNLYSNEFELVRPWIGMGYLSSTTKQQTTSGGVTSTVRDSSDTFRFTLGAETLIAESLAIRTSFDFTFEDTTFQKLRSPRFVAEFVNSPFDHFYFRIGGSIDFDHNIGILAGAGIKF